MNASLSPRRTHRAPRVAVVTTTRSHLDVLTAYALRYRAVAQQAQGARAVVVDLGAIETVDPAGLVNLGRLDEAPRPVVLCGARPAVARALRQARLHATLDVYESKDAAREALERADRLALKRWSLGVAAGS